MRITETDEACAICSGQFSARLLEECPACVSQRYDAVCLDCADNAEALGYGEYCGGSRPATYLP